MGDAVDGGEGHVASFGYAGDEGVVGVLDGGEDGSFLVVFEGTEACEDRGFGAAYYVDVDAEVVSGFLDVGDHAEYSYGAGYGGGFGEDVVGGAGDVVSSGGCVTAHGGDYCFLLCEEFDFTPDEVGGESGAARGVDSEDYCGDGGVGAEVAEGLREVVGVDVGFVGWVGAVVDLSLGVDYGYFGVGGVGVGVGLEFVDVLVVEVGDGAMRGVGEFLLELVEVYGLVDESDFGGLGDWGGEYFEVVDVLVESCGVDVACGGYGVADFGPYDVDDSLALRSVVVAHGGAEVGFDGAFVSSVFEDVESDAEFLGESFEVDFGDYGAVECDAALRCDEYGVGC